MIKFIATICIISMTTIGCTSKKAARTESSEPVNQELTMLVGTYTAGDSKGIYSFRFDEETGTATALRQTRYISLSFTRKRMQRTKKASSKKALLPPLK